MLITKIKNKTNHILFGVINKKKKATVDLFVFKTIAKLYRKIIANAHK